MPPNYIDLYCERTAPGLLGEPLNALTNLFFLVAAALLARRLLRSTDSARDDWILVTLVGLVGIGSLVFHMAATRPTSILDKLFIALFIYLFFQRYLVRVAGLGNAGASIGVVLFIVMSAVLDRAVPHDLWNGSVLYLPALLGLGGVTAWTFLKHRPGTGWFASALVLFLAAIFFRTIDLAVCAAFPYGTHFVWHSLNAVVLYACCRALLVASGRERHPP